MDSVIRTEAIEDRPGPAAADGIASSDPAAPTERLPIAKITGGTGAAREDSAGTQVRSPLITTRRDQCAACGSALASDQRYCVECGQRRGTARVPQLEGVAQRTGPATPARPPRGRGGTSVNNTLLAVIGTLLLALGVGVLIGRTSNGSSSKTPPVRVVTVAGTGAAGGAGAAASQPGSGSTAAAAAAAKHAGAHAAATPRHKVTLKVVKVGTPGKGPGYQGGRFTGKFFGPESEEK